MLPARTSIQQRLASFASAPDALQAIRPRYLRQKRPEPATTRSSRKRSLLSHSPQTPARPSAESVQSDSCPARDAAQRQKPKRGAAPAGHLPRFRIIRKQRRKRMPRQKCQPYAAGPQPWAASSAVDVVCSRGGCGFLHSKTAASIRKQPNNPLSSREARGTAISPPRYPPISIPSAQKIPARKSTWPCFQYSRSAPSPTGGRRIKSEV